MALYLLLTSSVQRTQHVKVWLSMAQFELSSGKTEASSSEQQPTADEVASSEVMQAAIQRTRAVYKEANDFLRKRCRQAEPDATRVAQEERILLLEAWRTFEVLYTLIFFQKIQQFTMQVAVT